MRLSTFKEVYQQCRCSQERVESLVQSFSPEEQNDMIEPDGKVHITCEYCSKTYFISL